MLNHLIVVAGGGDNVDGRVMQALLTGYAWRFNGVFTAGECSTLTTARDNIHAVCGGPGDCRLLDIFTWVGSQPQSVYLEVDEHPIEPSTNTYWASFMG